MIAHKRQNTTATTAIRSTSAYEANGNRLASQTDPRGNTLRYAYNSNDTVSTLTAPNGQVVSYGYDGLLRPTSVSTVESGKTYKNSYTYENDRLKTVGHNTTGAGVDVTYSFGYDVLGKPTTVQVGSQVLSTNVYDSDRAGKLRRVEYANGQHVGYDYDSFGRKISMKYNWDPGTRHDYMYDASGKVVKVRDRHMNRYIWTEYDEANRPNRNIVMNLMTNTVLDDVQLSYDGQEHLSAMKQSVDGGVYQTTYSYDYDDRPTEIGYGDSTHRVRYTYDGQGRLLTRRVNNGSTDTSSTYSYLGSGVAIPGLSTVSSTNLVSGIAQPNVSYSYGYDGTTDNILSEVRTGGSYAGTTSYVYDKLGQLTRVNDPAQSASWVYNYDWGGNITSKVKYAYTTGTLGAAQQTIAYAYGDSGWKDKLTAYNGTALTYDAGGNLTGDGTWVYSWQAGRELHLMDKGAMRIVFHYDHNGMRTKKSVAGLDTLYTVNGKQITHMSKGTDKLHFFYDGQGRVAIVNFNGATYRYVYNLQGDVVALVDSSGSTVVEYKYDAWGKIIGRAGSLVNTLGYLNPFRYRGYVYDEETGLYHLRSRYYKPEWGRFINADALLGNVGAVLSHNLYAYCHNNPIGYGDSNGMVSEWLLKAIGSDTLYQAYRNLPLITQLKHTGGGAVGALWTIDSHLDCIDQAAAEFGIEQELIQAVLFRELICVGLDDVASDVRFLLVGMENSTGIGQIRPSTAIAAEKAVYGECNMSVSEMWHTLQDPCANVRYLAMNLKSILMKNDIKKGRGGATRGLSDTYLAFARYNGKTLNSNTRGYASAVSGYYNAFKALRE